MKITKEQLKQIIREEIENIQEGDDYPAPHKMRKLVGQAKMDGRYKEDDPEKLKKDYDKHVRGTLRDPKHSEAHKKKVNEMDLFGKKKAASAGYDRAMKIRHDELADLHNRLKDALGDPNRLQQTASEIVKELALKFRNMDR